MAINYKYTVVNTASRGGGTKNCKYRQVVYIILKARLIGK